MKKNLLTSGIVNPFSPTLCRDKMYMEMKKIIMALIAVVLVFSLLPLSAQQLPGPWWWMTARTFCRTQRRQN